MKIVIYDNPGHPFQVQLSLSLAKRGYDVLHIYSSSFQTPKGNLTEKSNDTRNLLIKGLKLSKTFAKYSFIKRCLKEGEFGKIVSKEIINFRPDILISSNVPPPCLY